MVVFQREEKCLFIVRHYLAEILLFIKILTCNRFSISHFNNNGFHLNPLIKKNN